jgi:hypothetical protein
MMMVTLDECPIVFCERLVIGLKRKRDIDRMVLRDGNADLRIK